MPPVIALLSDFGTRDHYAGTMKGVMLTICPEATFVDITHDIEPQDIAGGAMELAATFRYFPAGTIFLAVVDPGVGSVRRPIAVDTGDYRFVAPDNGLLSMVLAETPPRRLVELANPRYARETISRTFEVRDRFAPAAAWLAKGIDLAGLGPAVDDYVRLQLPEPVVDGAVLSGRVMAVDRFGNLITNIDRASFDRFASGGATTIALAGTPVVRLVATYAEIAPGEVCALFGSSDRLEFSAQSASAALRLSLSRGAKVRISRK